MRKAVWTIVAAVAGVVSSAAAADIVLENARLRAVLGADGTWRSLKYKPGGRELLPAGKRVPFATARVGARTRAANRATFENGRLTVGFAGCETRLTYAVQTPPDWIVFRLAAVSPSRPSRLTLLRAAVTLTDHVGRRLGAAWDESLAVCAMGLNLQTQAAARRRGKYAELTATTQDAPGPRLEGAAAAIVAAPPKELRALLQKLAVAHGLATNAADGTPAKQLPIARQSYWFLRFGAKDADRVIDCCRRSGFRQVLMSSISWCRTVGHYTFRKEMYPQGLASLRRTVARLHKAGILVGMHCYASKVSKTDAYVTPVPDRRFWVDRTAKLAARVDAKTATIVTASDLREWPGSLAATQKTWEGGVAKHREVLLDDEIVRYERIGPEGKWDTFLGCKRGAWGTKAAAHEAGTLCRHYGVDGCINGYIIDQETTLLDETTDRLAGVFNACGFDMVYFDGGEDVDRRRFAYYVSKFQAVAMGKFRKRPIVHMGTIMTHNLWHSFTRTATVDTYWNTIRGRIVAGGKWASLPTVRDHIDRSVGRVLAARDEMIPGELGWFGIWPKREGSDGLQLDEVEYLMCKSLAHDAPISLQTSFSRMAAHPLTPGILEIVRAYERLRLAGKVGEAARARLAEQGKDFLLVPRGGGAAPAFAAVQPLEKVAGGREVRAVVGAYRGGAVAGVWHAPGKSGWLALPAAGDGAGRMAAFTVDGKPLAVRFTAGEVAVPVGPRRTLLTAPLPPQRLRKMLAEGAFRPSPPTEGRSPKANR